MYIKKKALMSLKEYLINKQEKKLHELKIINHFGSRKPTVLNSFSKVFLNISYYSRAVNSDGDYISTLSNISDSVMCKTVLAKYVLDKWRLITPKMK